MFISRTSGPILTKFDTMHPSVKGIQDCLNTGPHPLTRGDDNEILKIHGH